MTTPPSPSTSPPYESFVRILEDMDLASKLSERGAKLFLKQDVRYACVPGVTMRLWRYWTGENRIETVLFLTKLAEAVRNTLNAGGVNAQSVAARVDSMVRGLEMAARVTYADDPIVAKQIEDLIGPIVAAKRRHDVAGAVRTALGPGSPLTEPLLLVQGATLAGRLGRNPVPCAQQPYQPV